jgi:hypothetical protein
MARIKNWYKSGEDEWTHVSEKFIVDIEIGDWTQEIEHVVDLIQVESGISVEISSSMDINEARKMACDWMRAHPDPANK